MQRRKKTTINPRFFKSQGCQNFFEKIRTFSEEIRTIRTIFEKEIRTIRTFKKKSVLFVKNPYNQYNFRKKTCSPFISEK